MYSFDFGISKISFMMIIGTYATQKFSAIYNEYCKSIRHQAWLAHAQKRYGAALVPGAYQALTFVFTVSVCDDSQRNNETLTLKPNFNRTFSSFLLTTCNFNLTLA